MRAVVTGAAGFIGSSIVDRLLAEGHSVVGLDSLTGYYSPALKLGNLSKAMTMPNFEFRDIDLATDNLDGLFTQATHVFHQAGQPGVRASWGDNFRIYLENNVWATQRLLMAVKKESSVRAVVAASSSSVFGNSETYPTSESHIPRPISPYGVTKLAAEHLCTLFHTQFGVPVVSLRYFTVYGPRQRPDMAIARIIKAGLDKSDFEVYGDGRQRRDFTFVKDVVDANLSAATYVESYPGRHSVFNVGGNQPISLMEVIDLVEQLLNCKISVRHQQREDGDPAETGADINLIQEETGWAPRTTFAAGLQQQIEACSIN